jgi:hypothetical protein
VRHVLLDAERQRRHAPEVAGQLLLPRVRVEEVERQPEQAGCEVAGDAVVDQAEHAGVGRDLFDGE